MKIGIEVEGRLRGIPTLFCGAAAVYEAKYKLEVGDVKVSHVYISDNDNQLDYAAVGRLFPSWYVTLDVTSVRNQARPANVSLMLRCDRGANYLDVSLLTKEDQVKFEHDRNVIVLPMTAAVFTRPEEFEGDVEL